MLYFTSGDLKAFCDCTSQLIKTSGRERDRIINLILSAIGEFSRFHITIAFDDECDPYLGLESRQLIHTLFSQIPLTIIASDVELCPLLLKPVLELMQSEFCDVTGRSCEQLKQFYDEVSIMNQWFRADPRLWSQICSGFRIADEATQMIQEEIELISSDPESLGNSTPVRSRLNAYLRSVKGKRTGLEDFLAVFDGLVDLFDLVDLELFLEVFPGELHLKNGGSRYKPSFARKLALTAVKKWVSDHQHYKKNRDTVSRRSIPVKDDVIRACINAHLDLTKRDRDCEYLWSHLRKSWLGTVLKSCGLHLYEVFDHIENDLPLLNQFLMHLEELNETESIAELFVLSESLRADSRRRIQLDDPLILMLMSVMQMGRSDCLTSFFGPRTNGAFVLPFPIDFQFDGCPVDPQSHAVYIIDQIDQLPAVKNCLSDVGVVAIDVFFKAFWSARLERSVPSVVSIATEKKVFIIMANRMSRNSKSFHSALRVFFRRLLTDQKTLKVVGDMRDSEKDFYLWTLLVENPFDVLEHSAAEQILGPFLDLRDVYPRRSFGELVHKLLGGLGFCNYEENANWSRADSDLLRQTQLHYIASKSWLSLQLFHTITAKNARDIAPLLSALDCSQVFGSRFNCDFKMELNEKIEAFETWTVENGDKLEQARVLVEGTQEQLHATLKKDLIKDDNDLHDIEDIIEFDIHDDDLILAD